MMGGAPLANPERVDRMRAEIHEQLAERHQRLKTARKLSHAKPLPVARPCNVLSIAADQGEEDPRPFASGREPCPRCAVRGDIGCAHQRPFVPPDRTDLPQLQDVRHRTFGSW